ncbi:MAG: SOS response-associated peptidase [Anaerolineae bacterium]|nr:SOS response-associated peptidase [Anaerolineae bacterium]
MCGRFTLTADTDNLQLAFDLTGVPEAHTARFNIAPSQPIAVITNADPKALTFHQWGLIPSWAKDPKIGYKMINARAETAAEKPAFRAAFRRRRCLIPADGFYEWQKRDGGKVPMFIHLKDFSLFAFAGLWEIWYSPEGDEIRTATILTTEPNELMASIHNRMPVILHREDYETWLAPDERKATDLEPLLKPFDVDQMAAYRVSTFVNSPANDTPEAIEPVAS